MADVRTLLKAKRQESRISHQYASYNATGQLKCLACGTLIKYASAWEGHLGSKGHRSAIIRLREAELKEGEGKPTVDVAESQVQMTKRGGGDNDVNESQVKRRKLLQPSGAPPADYSDPAHTSTSDMEETPAGPGGADVESEYRRFQREILTIPDSYEVYERATVVAEPQVFTEGPLGSFQRKATLEGGSMATAKSPDEDRTKDEERELILDRLLDEERAQEEADMRVNIMRKRLETVKKKRQRMGDAK